MGLSGHAVGWVGWFVCCFLSCRQFKWNSVYLPGSLAEIGWQSHKKEEMFHHLEGDVICKSVNALPFRNAHECLLMVVWQTLPNRVWINVVIVWDLLFPFFKECSYILDWSRGSVASVKPAYIRGHMRWLSRIVVFFIGKRVLAWMGRVPLNLWPFLDLVISDRLRYSSTWVKLNCFITVPWKLGEVLIQNWISALWLYPFAR